MHPEMLCQMARLRVEDLHREAAAAHAGRGSKHRSLRSPMPDFLRTVSPRSLRSRPA